MAELPVYLQDEQNDGPIRDRMLARIPAGFDTSQGSFYWDILAAGAIEQALIAQWAQEVLRRSFAQTTFGAYLDLRAEEHGLFRRPATAAIGTVTFTRQPGVTGSLVIPAGTRVSTASTPTTPAIVFRTTAAATLTAEQTTLDVAVTAEQPGAAGNVGAGTIVFLLDPLTGIASVLNAEPTTDGVDVEDDATFRARYLEFVRNPGTSGNRADYVHWATEVPGVGAAVCVPVKYGPGTVSVAIVDAKKGVPTQTLIDAVQDYICPVWQHVFEAEDAAVASRFGPRAVVYNALTDDHGDSVRLQWDPSFVSGLVVERAERYLDRPGIWHFRILVKVHDDTADQPLLRIGVIRRTASGPTWNLLDGFGWTWNALESNVSDWNDLEDYGSYATTSPDGDEPAVKEWGALTLAAELGGGDVFGWVGVKFYWDGITPLDLWVTRLANDQTATLYVDQLALRSAFGADVHDGKAPIGAEVTVEAGEPVPLTISATLLYKPGFDPTTVRAAVKTSLTNYLAGLVFAADNDVRFSQIAQTILNTVGVNDYQQLSVEGGTGNVVIADQAFATLGTLVLDGQVI